MKGGIKRLCENALRIVLPKDDSRWTIVHSRVVVQKDPASAFSLLLFRVPKAYRETAIDYGPWTLHSTHLDVFTQPLRFAPLLNIDL